MTEATQARAAGSGAPRGRFSRRRPPDGMWLTGLHHPTHTSWRLTVAPALRPERDTIDVVRRRPVSLQARK